MRAILRKSNVCDSGAFSMNYEVTENDYQRAELAAHKIAPLFQCFQWQWGKGFGNRGEEYLYTPTVQQIADAFVELIEDFMSGTSQALETGRLGIKRGEDGYELYLAL